VAFTASGGYGMPFLAIGLWKFGFPETVNALVMFFTADNKFSFRAIAFLVDGYGTLLHHFSTSFTLVALMMHMFPRDRALTSACIVPIMQHMFILVKYHAHNTYLALELALEFWFQWEVIWNIPAFESHYGLTITRIGRGMAMTMLLAHWLYLLGSVLHMLDDACNKEKDEPAGDDGVEEEVSLKSRKLSRADTVTQFLATAESVDKKKSESLRQRAIHKAQEAVQAAADSAASAANLATTSAASAANLATTSAASAACLATSATHAASEGMNDLQQITKSGTAKFCTAELAAVSRISDAVHSAENAAASAVQIVHATKASPTKAKRRGSI